MKQAILLLTNRTDLSVREKYDKLVKEYGEKADVFLLFDHSSFTRDQELEYFKKVYTFSIPDLVAEGYTALEGGFFGNCQYPLLKFHKDYPEYDFIWRIEDDVFFSGDWSVLFDVYINDTSEMVSAKIRTQADDPTWYWWNSVKFPDEVILSPDEMYASFTPVFRLSAKALDCLEVEMRKGTRGHYEALVPTIIVRHGMTIRDMGGDGPFVNNGDLNRFYTNESHAWPTLRIQPVKPNMIYHPIKEKISRISGRRNCLLSVVGQFSLCKEWIADDIYKNFDIHLIVSDSSFRKYYDYADFIYGITGRKTELLLDYFNRHRQLLSQYDYFFIIDEKMSMNTRQINSLFEDMFRKNRLIHYVGKNTLCFRKKTMKYIMFLMKCMDMIKAL